ncbi:MAG: hypothetical protein PHH04_01835 [Thomasclavelia sp.]|nr:hypothetical protein [Thomasclavelia sp.]
MQNIGSRICPNCGTVLKENAYIDDRGNNGLSYLEIIVKDQNLKKNNYELRCSYCPKCGHVEFWIDFDQYQKLPHPSFQSEQELSESVNTLANYYNEKRKKQEEATKLQNQLIAIKKKAKTNHLLAVKHKNKMNDK